MRPLNFSGRGTRKSAASAAIVVVDRESLSEEVVFQQPKLRYHVRIRCPVVQDGTFVLHCHSELLNMDVDMRVAWTLVVVLG